MVKLKHPKTPLEMNFEEFESWAVSHIIFGIGEGDSLRSLMHTILDQSARNKVFGGGKPSA